MTVSIIQHAELDPLTSATTTAVTLTGTTAGNSLVAFAYANYDTVTGMAGNLSGALTLRQVVSSASGNQHLYAYSIDNIAGGNEIITSTWAATALIRPLCVVEIGGVASAAYDGSAKFDQTAPTTATDAVIAGTVINSHQPALVVGF